jgi:hypothetical protein
VTQYSLNVVPFNSCQRTDKQTHRSLHDFGLLRICQISKKSTRSFFGIGTR